MDILYAQEKLGTAIYDLATGTGDIRHRLFQAYLRFHTLSDDYFPEELKATWNELSAMLESKDAIRSHKGEVNIGSVENTLESITEEECSDIAKRIYNLNSELGRFE